MKPTPTHVVGYVLSFSDDGELEWGELGRGSLEECQRLVEAVPAIAYRGSRPLTGCRVGIWPLPQPDEDGRAEP